jgi:hypothetical protein
VYAKEGDNQIKNRSPSYNDNIASEHTGDGTVVQVLKLKEGVGVVS